MCIIYFQVTPNSCQRSVRCIEEPFRSDVILRSDLLSFHYSPKSFHNIQMWGIGRDIEQRDSSLFPYRTHLPNFVISVYTGIVKDNKDIFVYPERIPVEKINHLPGVDGLGCTETVKMVLLVNHSRDIESLIPLRGYIDVFCWELPTTGDISCTFSYISISCANADKKRLNVKSLTSLFEAFCRPSLSVRTVWAIISVYFPAYTEIKPSDLSRTARQCIRKRWISTLQKPYVGTFHSDSVNGCILIFIPIYILYMGKIQLF